MTADLNTSQTPRLDKDAPSTTQNAALRGASLAFGKPPVYPKPQINNYGGDGWALAAATKVGGGDSRQHGKSMSVSRQDAQGNGQSLSYQNTGSSVGGQSYTGGLEHPNVQQRISQLGAGGFLQPPGAATDQSRSPSFIAATLAASRSASVSPNPTGQRQPHAERPSVLGPRSPSVRSGSSSRESIDQSLDTTSIPPTTSLIGMFEKNNASSQTLKRPPVRRSATSASRRSPGLQRSVSPLPTRAFTPSPVPAKPRKPEIKSPNPTLPQVQRQFVQPDPPKPPPVTVKPTLPVAKPIPIPAKSTSQPPKAVDDDDTSSDDSFVSASDYKPSFRAALTQQNRRLTSASQASVTSAATIDSLANAIVASSLASSRAASPSRSVAHQQSLYPPPPPPRRNNNHSGRGYLFQPIIKEISRTPSPAKQVGLRTTMRKPKSKESIDEGERRRGKKSHLMKKHPHKHHEGDRKRWRDSITERERKRYEAVWASNKGLLMSDFGADGEEYTVCNLVVRDIFSRSRLHADVLEEVYSLVDRSGTGRLEREEFVVGLWLIDQRLKGRKLPVKVSESVWKSVGILGGIKVRKVGK